MSAKVDRFCALAGEVATYATCNGTPMSVRWMLPTIPIAFG